MYRFAISIFWRAGQSDLLPHGHLGDAFVPSSDDLAFADLELKWLSSVARRVEFLSIKELLFEYPASSTNSKQQNSKEMGLKNQKAKRNWQ